MSDASAAAPGVSVDTTRGIATIQFGHPKGNSLPAFLLRDLATAVDACGRDPAARVVVIRSREPGPFCGGASFEELRAIRDMAGGKAFFLGFARLILAMRCCPKIVIARVHGKTVGGGVGVVAAADYAIATANASVRLTELAIGIGPFVVGPAIERKVGTSAFQTLAIDAVTWRTAEWAERHGLFADVVADGAALDERVTALAERLAAANPHAMAQMKAVFWQGTDHWERMLDERATMSGTLVLSDIAQAAIAAAGRS